MRLLAGEERERMWAGIVHYWPGYEMELRVSGRHEFRIFLLEPLVSAEAAPTIDRDFGDGRRSA